MAAFHLQEFNGHKFSLTQFSIPTFCEHCSGFIWTLEKGFVCQGNQQELSVLSCFWKHDVLHCRCVRLVNYTLLRYYVYHYVSDQTSYSRHVWVTKRLGRTLVGDIVLCSCARHFTLSTQVYKPAQRPTLW